MPRARSSPSRINPAARFSDGKPVTPDDVIFSWELLRDQGRPNYRTYYVKVDQGRSDRRRAACASI